MNTSNLSELMARARALLASSREPKHLVALPPGVKDPAAVEDDLPDDYVRILKISDGPIFHQVYIYSLKSVRKGRKWPNDPAGNRMKEGGWFKVGKVGDNPLILQKESGEVWGFPLDKPWWMDAEMKPLASSLDDFLVGTVFSATNYSALFDYVDFDEWYELLLLMQDS